MFASGPSSQTAIKFLKIKFANQLRKLLAAPLSQFTNYNCKYTASNPSHPSLRSITFTGEFPSSPERPHQRQPYRREQILPVLGSAPPSRPNTQSPTTPRLKPPGHERPTAPGYQRTLPASHRRPLS